MTPGILAQGTQPIPPFRALVISRPDQVGAASTLTTFTAYGSIRTPATSKCVCFSEFFRRREPLGQFVWTAKSNAA